MELLLNCMVFFCCSGKQSFVQFLLIYVLNICFDTWAHFSYLTDYIGLQLNITRLFVDTNYGKVFCVQDRISSALFTPSRDQQRIDNNEVKFVIEAFL